MYSLSEPSKQQKIKYVTNICDISKLRTTIESYVKHSHCFRLKVQNIEVNVAVQANSITDKFLRNLLVNDNLKKLLCGNIDYLKSVISNFDSQRVNANISEYNFYYKAPTINHIEHIIGRQLQNNDTVDIPIAILRKIFIEDGYENGEVFDKSAFIRSLDLRICPYCGRAYIYFIENAYRKKGPHIVKPQIDHFFPKSKYPYLALSYQNLIPVCTTCNSIGAKGDNEPLLNGSLRFPYPYRFKENDIHFKCIILGIHYYDDENFKITITYSNNVLEEGCKDILSLNSLYEYHNHEAKELYNQISILASKAKKYYENMGISQSYLMITPQMVLGFAFSPKASRNELLYRFKKDLYEQFTENI